MNAEREHIAGRLHSESTETSYRQWLEARESYRPRLNYLAVLAREVYLKGITKFERFAKQEIEQSVEAILTSHDERKHSEEAIFGFIDPEKDLKRVSSLTAGIIWTWERAWTRNNKINGITDVDNPSPFAKLPVERIENADFERTDVRLVLETAAAVLETLHIGYPSGSIDSHRHKLLAGFIAQRGPDFAAAWIRGDHIRDYCIRQGLDAGQWLSLIARSRRTSFATENPQKPLEAVKRPIEEFNTLDVERVKAETGFSDSTIIETLIRNPGNPHAAITARRNRKALLTPEGIADAVGWGKQEVKLFFTPSDLETFARGNSNPLLRAAQVVDSFDTTLSIENIMKECNISRGQATILFPPSRRKKLAMNYSSNPLDRARKIIKRTSELAHEYSELSNVIIADLVTNNSQASVRLIADTIRREQANPPTGIKKNLWAWTVAKNPNSSNEQRLQRARDYIAGYRLFMYLKHTQQVDMASALTERTLYKRSRNTTSLPTNPADALEKVQDLAKQAGVTPAEMNVLLKAYASAEDSATIENDTNLTSLLQKLRLAAGNT